MRVFLQGWSKTWDETVPEERLLKMTPGNLVKQQEVQEAAKKKKQEAAAARRKKQEQTKTASAKEVSGSSKSVKRTFDDCQIKEVRLDMPMMKKLKSRSVSESSSVSASNSNFGGEKKRPSRSRRPTVKKEHVVAPVVEEEDTRSRRTRPVRAAAIPKVEEQEKQDIKKVPVQEVKKPKKKKVSSSNSSKPSNGVHIAKNSENDLKSKTRLEFGSKYDLDLPESLKNLLVDDHDLISRQRKTVMLPAQLSVEQLLASFKEVGYM